MPALVADGNQPGLVGTTAFKTDEYAATWIGYARCQAGIQSVSSGFVTAAERAIDTVIIDRDNINLLRTRQNGAARVLRQRGNKTNDANRPLAGAVVVPHLDRS